MKRKGLALLVIDVQEKFRPAIQDFDKIVENISKLVEAFKVYGIPIIHTEQYPQGLGPTVKELDGIPSDPIEKLEFSCLKNKEFTKAIKDSHIRGLVVCGIEAHVCVIQTVLDALDAGLDVYLVEDAISSRKKDDKKIAIARAGREGAKHTSTEMIIFQLIDKAGTDEFKRIQKIVR
jgi:nicotinamidase-related amidase